MSAQQIVDLLNELHRLDPNLLDPLIRMRWPCNQAIANHPTVVVDDSDPEKTPYGIGLLGILEGIAGIDGQVIGAEYAEHCGRLFRFVVLDRRVEPHAAEPLEALISRAMSDKAGVTWITPRVATENEA